ncbi:MAG: ParB/RepB/Spo0J family partition protein [Clostridiales bacterium]|nr:ParB/RepB/Spo0J family partition protein [Clostridiales bacterium]
MATNKGLGRGLGSLLGILDDDNDIKPIKKESVKKESAQVKKEVIVPEGETVVEVEISQIDNNPKQPRKMFDPTLLNELAQSIKIYGVIQPILLTKKGDRYLIVAGERRFRASIIAGKKTIPAIIKDFDDREIKEIALLENIQRQDLNPIETARAMKELMDAYGWTQETLSDRLGKSRPSIANNLRLLSLCPAVIDLVEKGKLSAGHARSLVVVTNPEVQLKLAEKVMNQKLTVRDMESAVKDIDNSAKKTVKTKPTLSMEMQEFKNNLERTFSTKIDIKGNDKKGKIIINYYNQDDLDRIYELIERM